MGDLRYKKYVLVIFYECVFKKLEVKMSNLFKNTLDNHVLDRRVPFVFSMGIWMLQLKV